MSKKDDSFPVSPPPRRQILDSLVTPPPPTPPIVETVDQPKRVQVVVTMTEDERARFKTAVAGRRTSIQDVLYAAYLDFIKRA